MSLEVKIVSWERACELLEHEAFDHIISIGKDMPIPDGFHEAPGRKLRIEFYDIVRPDPYSGREPCTYQQMEELVEFLRGCDGRVLIHCRAGISRSTATGYILYCIHGISEQGALKLALAAAEGDDFHPNQRMVWMADKILNRNWAMIDAYKRMFGSHDPYFMDFER